MRATPLPWTNIVRIAVGMALMACPAAAAEVEVGAVFQPEFNGALGRLAGGVQRDLLFGETVYLDEEVLTGSGSSTAILFLDETRLQVGANSRVVLDRYVFDPATGNGDAVIQFGQGIFRYISGGMSEDRVTLRTPTAVMAIRGTTLIVYVAPDNATQVAVIDGAVGVSPCGVGSLDATAGYSVVVSADCTESGVVPGVVTPPDPAVIADLDFDALSPAAGPEGDRGGDREGSRNGARVGRSASPGGGAVDPGAVDPGGGDPGSGGDPGGGGDSGGGDPGGGTSNGPGNGNGNSGNPGSGGGNTGGSGPGTGNGGTGQGRGSGQGHGKGNA